MEQVLFSPIFWWSAVQGLLTAAGAFFLSQKLALYLFRKVRQYRSKASLALLTQAEKHAGNMFEAAAIQSDFEFDTERQLLTRTLKSVKEGLPPPLGPLAYELHSILEELPRDLNAVEAGHVYDAVRLLLITLTDYTEGRTISASIRAGRNSLRLLKDAVNE